MLKRVKTSLSNTQKRNVKDAVLYIYCKMFCEILPKIKALPLAFVVSQNDWIVGKLIILEDYKMKQHYLDVMKEQVSAIPHYFFLLLFDLNTAKRSDCHNVARILSKYSVHFRPICIDKIIWHKCLNSTCETTSVNSYSTIAF